MILTFSRLKLLLTVFDGRLCMATGRSIIEFSLADPARPLEAGQLTLPDLLESDPRDASNDLVDDRWTAAGRGQELGRFATGGVPVFFHLDAPFAYVGQTEDGTLSGIRWKGPDPLAMLQVIDVTDPASIAATGR